MTSIINAGALVCKIATYGFVAALVALSMRAEAKDRGAECLPIVNTKAPAQAEHRSNDRKVVLAAGLAMFVTSAVLHETGQRKLTLQAAPNQVALKLEF